MEMGKLWMVCGAREGIGPATVNYLLFRGQTVVGISTNSRSGEVVSRQVDDWLTELWQMDVFKASEVEAAVQQILDRYGRIDRLINIGDAGLLSLRVFEVMQQAGRGHIIQFTPSGNTAEEKKNDEHTTIQSVCDDTDGVHYTLIDPGIFFQSTLFKQPEKYLS